MSYEELKKKGIIDENDEVWVEKVKSKVHYGSLNEDCTDFYIRTDEECGPFNGITFKKNDAEIFWRFCQKHGLHNKTSRKNNYDTVLNETIDILIRNYNTKYIRVRGVRKNLLIKEIKEKNKELNTGIVSRALKKMINLRVIDLHQQTKNKKLIIKGMYWTTYVKEKKNDK